MDIKACCVTGHREIRADKLEYAKENLLKEIRQAIDDGYTHFISGFAQGVDLIFAALVADLMEENPALTLEAAIPYRKRMQTSDGLFRRLLGKCKIIGVHSEEYHPSCYRKRNRTMVSQSQRVIAVYDGRKTGGTLFTMRYAHAQNQDVRVIEI